MQSSKEAFWSKYRCSQGSYPQRSQPKLGMGWDCGQGTGTGINSFAERQGVVTTSSMLKSCKNNKLFRCHFMVYVLSSFDSLKMGERRVNF